MRAQEALVQLQATGVPSASVDQAALLTAMTNTVVIDTPPSVTPPPASPTSPADYVDVPTPMPTAAELDAMDVDVPNPVPPMKAPPPHRLGMKPTLKAAPPFPPQPGEPVPAEIWVQQNVNAYKEWLLQQLERAQSTAAPPKAKGTMLALPSTLTESQSKAYNAALQREWTAKADSVRAVPIGVVKPAPKKAPAQLQELRAKRLRDGRGNDGNDPSNQGLSKQQSF